MGYSLGDDKRSFKIFDETNKIICDIKNKLLENNWEYDEKNNSLNKNNRKLLLESDQDHINSLYITDNSINWQEFCTKYSNYEKIYGNYGVESVMLYVSKNTNINQVYMEIEKENDPIKEMYLDIITSTKDLDDEKSFTVARAIDDNNCVELHYSNGKATIEYGTKISDSEWESEIVSIEWFNKDLNDEVVLNELNKLFQEYKENDFVI